MWDLLNGTFWKGRRARGKRKGKRAINGQMTRQYFVTGTTDVIFTSESTGRPYTARVVKRGKFYAFGYRVFTLLPLSRAPLSRKLFISLPPSVFLDNIYGQSFFRYFDPSAFRRYWRRRDESVVRYGKRRITSVVVLANCWHTAATLSTREGLAPSHRGCLASVFNPSISIC